jgi:hypothetical protein
MPPPIPKLAATIHVCLTLRVSKKPKPRTCGGALDAPIIEGEGLRGLIGRIQVLNTHLWLLFRLTLYLS